MEEPGTAAPPCAGPDAAPRRPRLTLPAGACDCHAHVFGPLDRFPYTDDRVYTPPEAPLTAYLSMLRTLGVERAVLVQPSVHGTDNRAMIAAMEAADMPMRGVVVVDPKDRDLNLAQWHCRGVRGVRFNLVDVADPSGRLDLAPMRAMAERVAPLGWHTELLIHTDDYPDLDRMFGDFPTDIVVGHAGYMRVGQGSAKGADDPGLQALIRLTRAGKAWVKLTGPYRISGADHPPYADIVPVIHDLVAAVPDQVVWGTDWPHPKISKPMPNDGDLCDLSEMWIPDAETRRRVLVDNPARLYGFDG